MECTIVILCVVLYIAIGGFLNGLSDYTLGGLMVIMWPLMLIVLIFIKISDVAEDAGYTVREFFKGRKENDNS